MLGCATHIIGHNIHKVDIFEDSGEIDKVSTTHRGQREQSLAPQRLAQVVHQQGEVVCIVRRGRNASGTTCRVLPVDIYSIQTVLLHHTLAIFGKAAAQMLVGGHLAEVATSPAAHREHNLKVGIIPLERSDGAQALLVVDTHAIEALGDVAKGVVYVSHIARIGHHPAPRSYIGHNDLFVSILFGTFGTIGRALATGRTAQNYHSQQNGSYHTHS